MKLFPNSSSKAVEEKVLEYVKKVCLDQVSDELSNTENDVLIQGLIAVSVNKSDVLIIHINTCLESKESEQSGKRPLEPDIVDLIDGDTGFPSCGSTEEQVMTDDKGSKELDLVENSGFPENKDNDAHEIQVGDEKDQYITENASANDEGISKQEQQKQTITGNDADISIVRHHQRRKRTYTNSAMSIKREPSEMFQRKQRKVNLSPSYLTSTGMEHFENLISSGLPLTSLLNAPDLMLSKSSVQYKGVLDISFNDDIVADLDCIDLEESLGGLDMTSEKEHNLQTFMCSQCGIDCSSADDLDKHQLLHLPFSVASVTGDIDIDLTEDCTEDESFVEAVTSSESTVTPPSLLTDHFSNSVESSGLLQCDQFSIVTNSEVTEEKEAISNTNGDQAMGNGTDNTSEGASYSSHSQITDTLDQDAQNRKKKQNCPICGKTFQRAQHLNEHILTHTREKPHKCSFCRKCYRLKSHLNRHIQQCH